MTKFLVTHDDVAGACELASLAPYPSVVAGSDVTVTAVTSPITGQTIYTVDANLAVPQMHDCDGAVLDVDNLVFDKAGVGRRNLANALNVIFTTGGITHITNGAYTNVTQNDFVIDVPAIDITGFEGYNECDTHAFISSEVASNLQNSTGSVGATTIQQITITGGNHFSGASAQTINNATSGVGDRDTSRGTGVGWTPINAGGTIGPFTVTVASTHQGGANTITRWLVSGIIFLHETAMGNRP